MGGFFGAVCKRDALSDVFFGTDYHSHLGTRRGGIAAFDSEIGLQRDIHNIENSPFRTKFDKDVIDMKGNLGIGCISDYEPQPLVIRSHHGTYAITTVGRISNSKELTDMLFEKGNAEKHLRILADCARVLNIPGFYKALLGAKSALDVFNLIREYETSY